MCPTFNLVGIQVSTQHWLYATPTFFFFRMSLGVTWQAAARPSQCGGHLLAPCLRFFARLGQQGLASASLAPCLAPGSRRGVCVVFRKRGRSRLPQIFFSGIKSVGVTVSTAAVYKGVPTPRDQGCVTVCGARVFRVRRAGDTRCLLEAVVSTAHCRYLQLLYSERRTGRQHPWHEFRVGSRMLEG